MPEHCYHSRIQSWLLLQAAIESVTLDNTGQPQMNAAALTHLQIVEAAANDAEKQVLEAERCAPAFDMTLCWLHKSLQGSI